MWFGVACTAPSPAGARHWQGGGGVCLCIAPPTGCVLNSVHVVPLPTRSCRWSISWLGPLAGESGLAQDSLRRAVAAVWRVCGLASPPAVFPTSPTLFRLGHYLLLTEQGR